jgi:hypothetical protein
MERSASQDQSEVLFVFMFTHKCVHIYEWVFMYRYMCIDDLLYINIWSLMYWYILICKKMRIHIESLLYIIKFMHLSMFTCLFLCIAAEPNTTDGRTVRISLGSRRNWKRRELSMFDSVELSWYLVDTERVE